MKSFEGCAMYFVGLRVQQHGAVGSAQGPYLEATLRSLDRNELLLFCHFSKLGVLHVKRVVFHAMPATT